MYSLEVVHVGANRALTSSRNHCIRLDRHLVQHVRDVQNLERTEDRQIGDEAEARLYHGFLAHSTIPGNLNGHGQFRSPGQVAEVQRVGHRIAVLVEHAEGDEDLAGNALVKRGNDTEVETTAERTEIASDHQVASDDRIGTDDDGRHGSLSASQRISCSHVFGIPVHAVGHVADLVDQRVLDISSTFRSSQRVDHGQHVDRFGMHDRAHVEAADAEQIRIVVAFSVGPVVQPGIQVVGQELRRRDQLRHSLVGQTDAGSRDQGLNVRSIGLVHAVDGTDGGDRRTQRHIVALGVVGHVHQLAALTTVHVGTVCTQIVADDLGCRECLHQSQACADSRIDRIAVGVMNAVDRNVAAVDDGVTEFDVHGAIGGDGQANLIVVGADSGQNSQVGTIHVFGSRTEDHAGTVEVQRLHPVVVLSAVGEVRKRQVLDAQLDDVVGGHAADRARDLDVEIGQGDVGIDCIGCIHHASSEQRVGLAQCQQVELRTDSQRAGDDGFGAQGDVAVGDGSDGNEIGSALCTIHRNDLRQFVLDDVRIRHCTDDVRLVESRQCTADVAGSIIEDAHQASRHVEADVVRRNDDGREERFAEFVLARSLHVVDDRERSSIPVFTVIVGFCRDHTGFHGVAAEILRNDAHAFRSRRDSQNGVLGQERPGIASDQTSSDSSVELRLQRMVGLEIEFGRNGFQRTAEIVVSGIELRGCVAVDAFQGKDAACDGLGRDLRNIDVAVDAGKHLVNRGRAYGLLAEFFLQDWHDFL